MAKILPTRRKKTPEQSVNQKFSISTGVCDNETNLEYTLSGNKNEWQCISRDFFFIKMKFPCKSIVLTVFQVLLIIKYLQNEAVSIKIRRLKFLLILNMYNNPGLEQPWKSRTGIPNLNRGNQLRKIEM